MKKTIAMLLSIILLSAFCVTAVAAETTKEKSESASTLSGDNLFPFIHKDKWGYMDRNGNVIVKPQYDVARQFSEGLGAVKLKEKYGYIDASGKIAIPMKYDTASSFKNGNAIVSRDNDEYTYYWIKPNGKYFFKLTVSDFSASPFCDGLSLIDLYGYDDPWCGYIDKKGAVVIKPDYNDAKSFSEGLAVVCKRDEDKYKFINTKGDVVIDKNFNWADSFSDGLAPVSIRGRKGYGYIDKTGKQIIPLMYENAHSFSEGLAAVMQNGKWGFIDKNNNWVIKPQYDEVEACVNGLIMIRSEGKVPYIGEFLYYIDKNNNIIKPKI